MQVTTDAGLGFSAALGASPKPWVFQPVTSVTLVGSAALKCAAKPHVIADVAVEMPSACFHAKDFLDGRYMYRRAVYLDILGKALLGSEEKMFRKGKVQWSYLHGDPRWVSLGTSPLWDRGDGGPGGRVGWLRTKRRGEVRREKGYEWGGAWATGEGGGGEEEECAEGRGGRREEEGGHKDQG